MRSDISKVVEEAFHVGMIQQREEAQRFAAIIAASRPKHILEIGSFQGGLFYLICQLSHNEGYKISMDIPYVAPDGSASATDDQKRSVWSNWALDVYAESRNSTHLSTYYRVKNILRNELLDLLVIDGDHSYAGVKSDYFMYKDLVKKGGLIVFHDIIRSHGSGDVPQFWSELQGDKLELVASVPDAEGRAWGGIGIIRNES